MHTHTRESYKLLFLFCCLMRNGLALKNDATEILYSHVADPVEDAPGNASLNRARGGGRTLENAAQNRSDRGTLGCRELRSTKYISDGQCTSVSPVKELVCAGQCLPAPLLPNWIGRRAWVRRDGPDWRCVNDKTRTQRIQLQCQDGSRRTYKITVVTGCKCKRYLRQHNESASKPEAAALPPRRHKPKGKQRHRGSKANGNWHESES
ncbi:sclerostin domain-containing protein 1a [Brachyhypopomus gauderio]|uniref:sclerostin domain-containing protein 1a n=1 Tax=Brachyhypopomus gauderio TaxID=698409 RepID=UPI004041A1C4